MCTGGPGHREALLEKGPGGQLTTDVPLELTWCSRRQHAYGTHDTSARMHEGKRLDSKPGNEPGRKVMIGLASNHIDTDNRTKLRFQWAKITALSSSKELNHETTLSEN